MSRTPKCSPSSKLCGNACIPKNHQCSNDEAGDRPTPGTAKISDLTRNKDGTVQYLGENWRINEPKPSQRKNKKMKVLAKKADRVKVIHFGHSDYKDYTQHEDPKRRRNYLTRASGIRNGQGQLTKDDPWSPNYWSIRKLWGRKSPQKKRSDAFVDGYCQARKL